METDPYFIESCENGHAYPEVAPAIATDGATLAPCMEILTVYIIYQEGRVSIILRRFETMI